MLPGSFLIPFGQCAISGEDILLRADFAYRGEMEYYSLEPKKHRMSNMNQDSMEVSLSSVLSNGQPPLSEQKRKRVLSNTLRTSNSCISLPIFWSIISTMAANTSIRRASHVFSDCLMSFHAGT